MDKNIISNPDISTPDKDRDNKTTKDVNLKNSTRFPITIKEARQRALKNLKR